MACALAGCEESHNWQFAMRLVSSFERFPATDELTDMNMNWRRDAFTLLTRHFLIPFINIMEEQPHEEPTYIGRRLYA
jgi:hypothetical protein